MRTEMKEKTKADTEVKMEEYMMVENRNIKKQGEDLYKDQ